MLVDSSTPLVDSRVEEVRSLDSNLTLLEDQGLWIQVTVLHCSCAKAASLPHQLAPLQDELIL